MATDAILICYDGSEGARRAIGAAASLFGPRRAVVLDLGPQLTLSESLAAISLPAAPAATLEELNDHEALERAEEGAVLARRAGFDATARGGVTASTWAGIVGVADELDAAVIVIGSRGLNAGRELLAGSVSHEVATHVGRPVLIVPPPRGGRRGRMP